LYIFCTQRLWEQTSLTHNLAKKSRLCVTMYKICTKRLWVL
jgi:hypothetical protein